MTARAARSAVIALSLLVCGGAFAAQPAGAPVERTYRGKVKMVSSAAIPGILPAQRDIDLTMKVTRQPNRRVRVITEGIAGPGMRLRLDAIGRITKTTPVAGGEVLDIDFDGEDYRAAVETGLNDAFAGVRIARGVHVPITSASGSAKLTLVGSDATLQSTSTVERANAGGLRGMAVNRMLPSRITNGFHGQLSE